MARRCFPICLLALLVLPALGPWTPASAGVTATFRYPLSNFSGPVRSQWARLAIDRERNEIYALNQRANDIRIFDEHGMEIFVFGDGFSTAEDIAIGEDGDIFLLSTGYQTSAVHLLNYRGEHVAEIPLQNVPAAFSSFVADRLLFCEGSLYLVDSDALLVIVTDQEGRFQKGYDLNTTLRPFLDREERKQKEMQDSDWAQRMLEDVSLSGFTVDRQGNLLFTVPVLFSAFRLSPNGEVANFGRPGSGPGKFGVVAGIAIDDLGYIYVADRLRSVVLVFDPSFAFQTEFGYRGDQPSSLIVPDDLAVDSSGNVYVGQAANRGVSVFRVVYEAAVREEAVQRAVVDEAVFQKAVVEDEAVRGPKARQTSLQRPLVEEAEVGEAEAQEGRVPEVPVQEAPAPAETGVETPKGSERSSQAIEEDVSDEMGFIVDLSGRVDFIVDQGGNVPPTDSEQSGWTVEEDEFDHLEENQK